MQDSWRCEAPQVTPRSFGSTSGLGFTKPTPRSVSCVVFVDAPDGDDSCRLAPGLLAPGTKMRSASDLVVLIRHEVGRYRHRRWRDGKRHCLPCGCAWTKGPGARAIQRP